MTAGDAVHPAWPSAFDDFAYRWHDVRYSPVPTAWCPAFEEAERSTRALQRAGEWVTGPASLLGVLDRRRAETTHSRILAWLLDPEMGHRLGDRVFRAVLTMVAPNVRLTHDAPVSVVEEEAALDPMSGRIGAVDIVARAAGLTVVIENKIWSGETNDQLDRYANHYAEEQAILVYLTPGGRPPSPQRESASQWVPLSWRRDLLPTLSRIASAATAEGRHCSALDDYVVALREEFG